MVAAKYIGAPVVDTLLASLFPIYDFGSSYAQAETAEGKMLAFIALVPFERLGKTAANALNKTVDLLKKGKSSEAYRYFQIMAEELKHDNVALAMAGNGGNVRIPKNEIPSQAMASKSKSSSDKAIFDKSLLGANGTQISSTTVWKGEGKNRIDVENPSPGRRAGQIHYQDNAGNKWLYNPKTKSFEGAPKSVNRLLEDKQFKNAIDKAMRYLGEK